MHRSRQFNPARFVLFALLTPLVSAGAEVLVFDWNKPIPARQGRYIEGINKWKPDNQPVRANFDWTAPPNYAAGTYHVRVLIRKMAVNDDFKIIFNHWQFAGIRNKQAETNMQGPELAFSYQGAPIKREFAFPVSKLRDNNDWDPAHWPKFDWAVKRDLVGFFFPNFANSPPSAKISDDAYPIDMRFTVVVVAPGAPFSGWQNYP